MKDVSNTGSIYDKIINEEWFSTPDMGEYQSNRIYLDSIEGLSPEDVNGDGNFFYAENPPTLQAGYHSDLEVVAIKLNAGEFYNFLTVTQDGFNERDYNRYDGDTLYIPIDNVQDTNSPFQLYYSDNIYSGVKDYIRNSMKLQDESDDFVPSFGVRFVGINTPEVVHYNNYICALDESDVYKIKYKDLMSGNPTVWPEKVKTKIKHDAPFSSFKFRKYIESENDPYTYVERDPEEYVYFIKFSFDKRNYPNYAKDERVEFHEFIEDVKSESSVHERVCKLVTTAYIKEDADIEYYNQSKRAQKIVTDAFSKAEDCIILLDTNGLNNKKKNLPDHYLKSYERSTESPFYALYDMWNNVTGRNVPAYKYSAYRIPGQEANGRFLAAVYVKMNHNGKSIWVNLNKKVLYECSLATIPEYSSSVDDLANYSYLADGFKLWTYRYQNQLYIDYINKATADTRDDRYKIQSEIAGCNLSEMEDHTIMIGDTLFMIPPTSIKVINQTKTVKSHLLRSKGSVNKTLPKTERIIQLDLFFNEESGINGIPYEQKLPNGQTVQYSMNGLRGLIAQFKLTPFLPIHNSYINKTLGIDAVSLVSYSINTMPNYPRTLQVTIMMYEFEWIQYLPCQAVPNTDENLYTNGFSNTIYFPLLRWHYQKALSKGDEISKSLNFTNMKPTDKSYISATLGNEIALQPMNFKEPTIKFYVPDETLLDLQKQLKIKMATAPLGSNYNFTEVQKTFIKKMASINDLRKEIVEKAAVKLYALSRPENGDDVVLNGIFNASSFGLIHLATLPYHKKSGSDKKTKTSKDLYENVIKPAFNVAQELFNEKREVFGNVLLGIDMCTSVVGGKDSSFFKIAFKLNLNKDYFESEEDFDLIRQYCSKQKSLTKENIFKDFEIKIEYTIEFQPQTWHTPLMKKGLDSLSNDSITAMEFLSSLSIADLDETFSDSEITDDFQDIKDSMDTEDEDSIKFFHYDLGEGELTNDPPIITNIVSTYNNVFANVGLKAVDGHAAQYTGATDSSLEIEMIGSEYTAGQVQLLNRVCMDYLIRYRKILKTSPLRIDCDLTRMLGIYEVIIDNISIDTIPEYPGKFKINLRLSSVDRTLRNKENLRKIQGVDNSSIERNEVVNTKNYFDLKTALGKAELYPDLQLPTVRELEEAGFYFIKNKYQNERVYVDPDFYFIYWYPSFAETLRTSICEYFSDPSDLNYVMEDDLFNDVFNLRVNVGSKETHGALYEVLNWDDANQSYNNFVEKVKSLVEQVNIENGGNYSEEELNAITDYTSDKLAKFNKLQGVVNTLQETIDTATDNTYQANSMCTISVKDIDILDESNKAVLNEIEEINKNVEKLLIDKFKNKIENDDLLEPEADPPQWLSRNNVRRINKQNGFLTDVLRAMCDYNDIDTSWDISYINQIVKAAAVGAMAREGLYGVGRDGTKEPFIDDEDLYYPPQKVKITNEMGIQTYVPICLYEAGEVGELLIAHDEETRSRGVYFGKFAIKKYSADELSLIFNRPITRPGFLDPYYNAELYSIMISPYTNDEMSIDEEKDRVKKYIDGLLYDNAFIIEAHFRQMLVWLYILMKNKTYFNNTIVNCRKLLKLSDFSKKEKEEIFKFLTGEDLSEDTEVSSSTGKVSNKDAKSLYKTIIASAEKEMEEAEETTDEMLENQLELLKENSKSYVRSVFCGILQTVSAIAMSGLDSSVLRAVSEGNLGEYINILSESEAVVNISGLSTEQKRMARFVQFCNDFTAEEDDKFKKNPIAQSSYNNRIQRAYLKAADDPKTYMLHSYYDMVMNDKRGTMARAFPTYYMLLIDEGRQIGLWRLQDNFYDMNSIIEFEVVKSRKIAADTARIVMTNLYGIFNTDDEDMKDENVYTMRDIWDSLWSPKKYYQKEYARRSNAREINSAKMQPGARVHLRMGYSSNANNLPIVFNGAVAEFEAGETMTLICQGDGVEIANPHMFNAIDGKDLKNLAHRDKMFGYKQLMELWDNLATPRDLLVLPLAAEGTWSQELLRKMSNGRLFNSNPFGIVHFGDRKFQTIFTTNGEVEQNIYEAISKPSFNYEKSGIQTVDDGIEKEYRMDEAPRVKVKMEAGKSYWDIMHIASSLSPDFICAIAPFQLRSTIFHGHPRFYYAYDYMLSNGKILEKRKPYQQYHIYTSYSDIIDNKISTSAQDVRTNAVGYYTGPSWLAKKTESVGPLFVDIDIFPEYQKSTSFNLGFEYKNSDILPFNVAVVSKVVDLFNFGGGLNGYQTAWRATANGLKNCIKDMYKGELIVMGDPSVKPFDRMVISDMYEDIAGTCEVESVVHMFSTETGFTTSITPDCISAIDNKYETPNASINQQVILPALISSALLTCTNLSFHRKNRTAYLLASRTIQGVELSQRAFESIMTIVGKENVVSDAYKIGSKMPKAISDLLQINPVDIKLYDMVKDITSVAKKFSNIEITNGAALVKALDSIDSLSDIMKSIDSSNIKAIEDIIGSDRFSSTEGFKLMSELSSKLSSSSSTINKSFIMSVDKIDELKVAVDAIGNKTDDVAKLSKMLAELVETGKDVNLLENKELIKSLKALEVVDDFTSASSFSTFTDLLKVGLKNADDGVKVITKLDDVVKAALTGAKGLKLGLLAGAKSIIMNNLIMLAVETVLVKGTQEFITRKLRNLQVLTIYPLKKDNNVWTAGLNGHQGSVYGSLAYDEPGWLEKLAISFFDAGGYYGSQASRLSPTKYLAFLRDLFFTTDEMREIVNGYKRGSQYSSTNQSDEKLREEQINELLETVAKANLQGYTDYKKIYLTSRLKASQIKDKDEETKLSYATWNMPYIDNIETTKEIALKLENIITTERQQLNKTLYEKGLLRLAYDEDVKSENFSLVTKSIMIDETNSDLVKVKVLQGQSSVVYDIPYLRPEACILFNAIISKIVSTIQPDYTSPTCEFEELKKHPIILHSATRINSDFGWRSTGFLFTIEVKNYDNVSNIISEIEKERDNIAASISGNPPFSIQKESTGEFGVNAYTFFLHCPK